MMKRADRQQLKRRIQHTTVWIAMLSLYLMSVPVAFGADMEFGIFRDNAGLDDIGTSVTDMSWDTTVSTSSTVSLDGNTIDFTLSDSGHYLLMYSIPTETSGGSNRSEMQSWIRNQTAATNYVYGRGQGYIRRSGNADEGYNQGAAILNVNAADKIRIQMQRTDSNSATVRRRAGKSGVSIIKLSDAWDYLRSRPTSDQTLSGSFVDINLAVDDEMDAGSFSRSGASITLKTAGHYLVTYNVKTQNSSTSARANTEAILTLDGSEIDATRTTTYLRGSNGTQDGMQSYVGIIATSSANQILRLQARIESTSPPSIALVAAETGITIAKLPDTAEYVRVGETAGGQDLATSRTSVTFDETLEEDTSALDHDATNTERIQIQRNGDYLFFSTMFANRASSGTRETQFLEWRNSDSSAAGTDGSGLYLYGNHGQFNRGDQGNQDAYSSGSSAGIIMPGLTSSQYIELTQINEAANSVTTYQANRMGLQGVNIESLIPFGVTSVTVADPSGPVVAGSLAFQIVFNKTMDTGVAPTITYDPTGITGPQTVSTAGVFSTTNVTNDTYTVYNDNAITTSTGDGVAAISISGAQQLNGPVMSPDTSYTFTIDTSIDHYTVTHDGTAITNVNELITIEAKTINDAVKDNFTGSITVSVGGETGEIVWVLQTGNGSFADGGSGNDTATYTFSAADNGVVVLALQSTATDTLDIEVSDGTQVDDNTHSSLVVNADSLDHFEITHDNAGIAGVGETVTVTAKNNGDAVMTGYTGSVTLDTNGTASAIIWAKLAGSGSFADGGPSVDTATYTFDAADNGVAIFQMTGTSAEAINISVADGGVTDDDTEGNLTLGPAALEQFGVSHDTSAFIGVAETIIFTAQDQFGNTVDTYTGTVTVDTDGSETEMTWALGSGNGSFTDGGASVDTATYTFDSADNGSVSLTLTSEITGSFDIDITGDTKTDNDGEGNLQVITGTLSSFDIAHSGNAVINQPETVVVTALDGNGYVVSDYTGQITLDTDGTANTITWALTSGSGTFVDGGGSVDTATYTFAAADNGAATFTIDNSTIESVDVDVTGDGQSDDDTEGNLNFSDQPATDSLLLNWKFDETSGPAVDSSGNNRDGSWINNTTSSTTVAPTSFTNTYSAQFDGTTDYIQDADGENYINGLTAFTVAVWVNADATGNDDGIVYAKVPDGSDNVFGFRYDAGGASGGGTNVIKAGFTATGGQIQYESANNVQTTNWQHIAVTWSSGNQIQMYINGALDTPTFNGSAVSGAITGATEFRIGSGAKDASAGWDGLVDDVRLYNRVLTATEIADLANGNALPDHFEITHDNAAQIDVAETITVTVKDDQGNTITDYTGQITLDTNGTTTGIAWTLDTGNGTFVDGGASVDTATYTFSATDNGVAVFTITNSQEETVNIYVSDGSIIDDNSEGNLIFAPSTPILDHFVITHDNSGEIGIPEAVTITAMDQFGNTLAGYTGTITLDTNGLSTAISWSLSSGNGTFVDGGGTVDTATYQFDVSDNGVTIFGFIDTVVENVDIDVSDGGKVDDDTEGLMSIGPVTGGSQGPILYWSFDDTASPTLDISGNGYHGTWQNNVTASTTVAPLSYSNPRSANFDGNTDYILDSDGESYINGLSAVTVSVWVKADGTNVDDGILLARLPDETDTIFGMRYDAGGASGGGTQVIKVGLSASGGGIQYESANNTQTTNWQHLVFTWSSGNVIEMWIDGVKDTPTFQGSSVAGSIAGATEFRVGMGAKDTGTTGWDGHMDELRIYDRVLSETEIQDLANGDGFLDHFEITHDGNAVVGFSESVTVQAINDRDELMTNYTGAITLDTDGNPNAVSWSVSTGQGVFSDGGGASDSASYTFDANDGGQAVFLITNTVSGTLNLSAYGDGKVDDDTEGSLVVAPGVIDYFVVAHDGDAVANSAETVTITAYDSYGNIKDDYTGTILVDTNGTAEAIAWALQTGNGTFTDNGASVDTATYTFSASDNGSVVLTMTGSAAEAVNIDVSGDGKTDQDLEGNLNINPSNLDHFVITHDTAANVGVAESVTVTAYDQYGNIKTDYAGTVTLDTNGTPTSITWALETGNGSFTEGGSGVDIATYTFDAGDSGVATFTVTNTVEESINISVSDGGQTDDDTEGDLVIGAAILDYFVVSHDGVANAGVDEAVTITAKDSLGNTLTTFTGQVTVDTSGTATSIVWSLNTGSGVFNDGGASVDTATYTFDASDNGVVVLNVKNTQQESIDIDVSSTDKTDDDTDIPLVVGAPVLDYFLVIHDGNAVSAVPENITIRAMDSVNTVKTDYTGQITVDTNGTPTTYTWALSSGNGTFLDGGASVDTAVYTFDSSDNGEVVLTLEGTIMEVIDVDVSGDGKSDNDGEGNLVISSGAIDHFVIEHDNSGLVNIPESITISAKDASENTVTDYVGSITVDTNGTATTIDWALQSGNGSFTDGGASVDTATYTFAAADNGTVTLTISNSTEEFLNISVSNGSQADDDLEGELTFASASDIFIDNEDGAPFYTEFGTTWSTRSGGTEWGTNWRRDTTHNTGSYARWTPNIPVAGNYSVSCMGRSPATAFATDAPFTVYYDGGSSTTLVNQQVEGNPNFSFLGTFPFQTGTGGYVQLDDTTTTTLDFSADVCKWEIQGIATASANSVTNASVGIGSTNNVILDFLVTNAHTAVDTVTSVKVNNVGSATDAEIAAVKLFYDSNNSGDFTPGVDTEIGNSAFGAGTKIFTGFNVPVPASGGTEQFFVVLDVAQTAVDGHTLDVAIPVNGITLTNAGAITSLALNSSGSRELDVILDHFEIFHDGTGIAGSNESITITAKDAFGNTKVDYTGTLALDTDGTPTTINWELTAGSGVFLDGGASVDTATYVFSISDSGTAVFALNSTMAETLNISAVGGGVTDDDAEGNLVIQSAALDHYVLTHDGTAIAGGAEEITVTVEDVYGNIITNFTGNITLDTNGTATAIAWSLLDGFGVFSDGGASVDTATYTFATSDEGSVMFALTDNAAEFLNIAVTGGGKTDDDTEGLLAVVPDTLDHFLISHPGVTTTDTAAAVTITAIDSLGNTKTDYTGQITVDTNGTPTELTWTLDTGNGVFTDGGPSADTATYTFASSDSGVVVLNMEHHQTETINITVTGDGKSDDDTEGNIQINPGAVNYFTIMHDGTGITGVSESVIVTAYDSYDNVKTDYAGNLLLNTDGTATTIAWSLIIGNGVFTDGGTGVDTATYAFDVSDNGVATFGINNTTAETVDIDVSDGGATDDETEGSFTFVASGIDHFRVIHDNNAIAGQDELITIRAENANNNVLLDYAGQITIDTNGTAAGITWSLETGNGTFVDGGAGNDTATYTFVDADDGVVVLRINNTTEESLNISVSGEGRVDENTEGDLSFNPSGLDHFVIIHDTEAVAGVDEIITILAKDANETTIGYTGSVTLDTNGTATAIKWSKQTGNGTFVDGGPSVDTATYTFVANDNGQVVLRIQNTKTETINISTTSGGITDDDSEGNLTVIPGAIDHFVITHDGVAEANVADNVVIRAEDAYNNLKTDYTGQITMDTNGSAANIVWAKVIGNGIFVDGGASVDTATYTYNSSDNGQVTLRVTDTVAEALNITVTGDGRTDDDSEGNLVVGPTSLDYFIIAHDNSAEAGVPENITVTAYDIFDNLKNNFTGTVTLNTNGTATAITWALATGNGVFVDGGPSSDTANYTFDATDNGVAVFTLTDSKVETIDVDVAGSGKTDTDSEGDLVITSSGVNHFVITHDGTAEAGTAENIVITAYDAFNNIKDDYIGQITVDTNGTATTIAWGLVSGNGTFVDGGAAVDTATYTYSAADNGVVTLSVADTLAETLNLAVQAGSVTDDNSEGNLIVQAAVLNNFIIAHDNIGITNSAEPFSVTARDVYQNTKTNYAGTITLSTTGETGEITWALITGSGTFTDNGSGNDTATYTFAPGDNGFAEFTVTSSQADTINIAVADGGVTDENNEGDILFSSDQIIIDNLDTGYSESGGGWTNSSNGLEYGTNWRRDTAPGTGSTARWTPTIDLAGNYEVFAFWTTGGGALASDAPYTMVGPSGSTTVDVNQDINGNQWNSLGVHEFAAGSSGYVELTDDANNDICADAIRWILVGSADATANAVTTSSISAGATNLLILDITVSNNTPTNDAVTSIVVNNVGTLSDAEIASVKLYYDSNNSGDYTPGVDTQVGSSTFAAGTRTFSGLNIPVAGSDTQEIFVVIDLANTVDDGDTLDVEIPVDGIQMSNAPDLEDTALNSTGVRTVALSVDHYVVSHDNAGVAGVAETVTVSARDQYGNAIPSFAGLITLDTNGVASGIAWSLQTGNGTFIDNGASVDTATYQFVVADGGSAVFTVTDNTAETLDILVTGEGASDDDSEGGLVIAPAGLDHFTITHDTTATAGQTESIVVAAKDQFNNTVDGYVGTINLDTNGTATAITWDVLTGFGIFADGGASVDTATYTFSISDNSQVTFLLTDTVTETLNISVADGGMTDDDTEGNLVVSAAGLDHFVLSHDGVAITGIAENVTITAVDSFGNTKLNYTGQITMDTDGLATAISWANVDGNGTFVDGGVSVDTATYTFTGADNGEVTLSITDTQVETLNISTIGDGKTDDDTEGNLVVTPGAVSYFKIFHDGLAAQSVAENITIVAYDANDNVKTDYTGQITVDTNGTAAAITWALVTGNGVFNDDGPSADTATYTFNASDNGTVVLSLIDDATELLNLVATDGSATDDNSEPLLEVVATGFHHFTIFHDGNAIVGEAENVIIEARDASEALITNFTGTLTLDTNGTASAIAWALVSGNGTFIDGGTSVDTAQYGFNASDNGSVTLSITNTVLESVNISASGSGKTDDNTEGDLVFNSPDVDHFRIIIDGSATAGVAEQVTIIAENVNNDPVTNYAGTITVDTNGTAGTIAWVLDTGNGVFTDGGTAVDTATYAFNTSDNGSVTLALTNTKAETLNISVSGDGSFDENTEGDMIIAPATHDHFTITHDGNAQAGIGEQITVTAKDFFGNTVTDYTGQIDMDTDGTDTSITWALVTGSGAFVDDGASVDTASYTYVAQDNGVVVLNITDLTLESINISVSGDGRNDDDTEGLLVVGAGVLNHFVVGHDNAGNAGVPETVIITAYDIYGNIKTNYTGVITIDTNGTASQITWALVSGFGLFTDGGSAVDTATYTFVEADNGVVTLTITDNATESIDIDVAGNGKLDDDTEGNLVIAASGLDHFEIIHDGSATAGVAESITIRAKDIGNNTILDFADTITVDTDGAATSITWGLGTGNGTLTDGGASVDTATYTFDSSDNGEVILTLTDTTTDTLNITVTSSGKVDDDTEGSLVVAPGTLNQFIILHDGEAIQSVAESVTVTAQDQYGNIKTDYVGTITLDTNGTATSITWALNAGNGSFTDGGASVDTATYTFDASDNGTAVFFFADSSIEVVDVDVSDGGVTDDDSEGTLTIIVSSSTVTAAANVLSSGFVNNAVTDQIVLSVSLTNNSATVADTLESVTVSNVGTVLDNEIATAYLYYDSNNSGDYTSGVDAEAQASVFSGGSVTFSNLAIMIPALATEHIYVVVDLAGTASDTSTLDAAIPVNGMSFENAPDAGIILLNSTGLYTVDAQEPGAVSGLATVSHINATASWDDPQSADNTVTVTWLASTDSGSGLDGYSIVWDTFAATLPDTTKDLEETALLTTSPTLGDSSAHYFHIRAVDNAGNWASDAEHIGPFYIDATAPDSASIDQITESAGQGFIYASGDTIYYSGRGFAAFTIYVDASDASSGLARAVFPTITSTGGTDASPAGSTYEFAHQYVITAATTDYLASDITIYDQAGNQITVPFNVILDDTAPNTVSNLSSSTHTPNVSSADNDITFIWSDVADADSGIAGYNIIVDTESDTIPPTFLKVASGIQTFTRSDLENGSNYYVHIRPVDNVGNWGGTTHLGPFIIGRGSLDASLSVSENVVSTGQDFTVTMNVSNSGSATINNVDVTGLTVNSVGGATATTSSDPTAQNITSGNNINYQWTYTAGSTPGTVNFEGIASGTDEEGVISSLLAKSADVTIVQGADLGLAISASPTSVKAIQTTTLTVTITNTGTADAINVAPVLTPSGTASPVIDSGPTPSTATIVGGGSQQYTFKAHAVTDGTAIYTASVASGVDENSNNALSASPVNVNLTVDPAPALELTSEIVVTPTVVNLSDTITVTMSVQNTGTTTINTIVPSSLTIGGSSSDAVLDSGPSPANVASLSSGQSQDFVWTYTAGTTLGTVNFTGNAAGVETSSTASTSNNTTLQIAPATLSSSIVAAPTEILTLGNIGITMTVTNTAPSGGATANNVTPSPLTIGGSSGANLSTGPTPSSANLAPGESQNFMWVYKAGLDAGTVNFTGSASGTDSNSSSTVSSTASSSSDVTVSSLEPDWIYPTGAATVGPIRSIPIAYNGAGTTDHIYFGSDDGNLYALNASTKALEYTFTAAGAVRGLPYPSTELDGGSFKDIIYFGTLGNTAYARWADNTERWTRVLGETISSAVLYDFVSNVYFGTTSNNVYALASTTGNNVWVDTTTIGAAVESAPTLVNVPTLTYDEVYYGAADGIVYAFNAADGTSGRTFDTGFGSAGEIRTAPIVALQVPGNSGSRRLLLFGTANGRFYAVNTANLSVDEADTGWATNPVVAGDAIYSAPWVDTTTRRIYFGSRDGKLYAINLSDGTSAPNFPVDLGVPIEGWPIVYDGVCYIGAEDGKIYAVDVSTGEYVPGWPYDTGDAIKSGGSLQFVFDASWNLTDVLLLIGSDSGKLYGFDVD